MSVQSYALLCIFSSQGEEALRVLYNYLPLFSLVLYHHPCGAYPQVDLQRNL